MFEEGRRLITIKVLHVLNDILVSILPNDSKLLSI